MATKRMEILLFTWLAAVAFTVPAVAQNPDMAVVVSDRNRVTTITPAELRRVFAGERRSWAVGLPINRYADRSLISISWRDHFGDCTAHQARNESD